MRRPIIGVSGTYLIEKQQIQIKDTYTNAVLEAGGLPVILPVVSDDETMEALLECMDGLLLSGGGDVDPSHYGEEREDQCGEANAIRDSFELKITEMAVQRRMPIFGICRGVQVLNVVYGGKLIQDIPSACGFVLEKHRQPEPYDEFWHEITLVKDGLLARVTGCDRTMTNSMHHQAISELGGTLIVEAQNDDGIIEAVSDRENDAVFGVQFHPEYLTKRSGFARALFGYFISKAREYSEIRS